MYLVVASMRRLISESIANSELRPNSPSPPASARHSATVPLQTDLVGIQLRFSTAESTAVTAVAMMRKAVAQIARMPTEFAIVGGVGGRCFSL